MIPPVQLQPFEDAAVVIYGDIDGYREIAVVDFQMLGRCVETDWGYGDAAEAASVIEGVTLHLFDSEDCTEENRIATVEGPAQEAEIPAYTARKALPTGLGPEVTERQVEDAIERGREQQQSGGSGSGGSGGRSGSGTKAASAARGLAGRVRRRWRRASDSGRVAAGGILAFILWGLS